MANSIPRSYIRVEKGDSIVAAVVGGKFEQLIINFRGPQLIFPRNEIAGKLTALRLRVSE